MLSRSAVTVSPTSPAVEIGTKNCTASPSSDEMAGETCSTPSTAEIVVASSLIWVSCAALSTPSPVTTTTAGMLSPPVNCESRSCTWVDSADDGRNED